MSGIGNWRPAQDAHAIQMAAVGINFREPITSVLLQSADQAVQASTQKLGLAVRNELKEFGFLIGPGGQPQPQGQTAGAEYLRQERPDFVSDKFVLSKNFLRYEEHAYTRWAVLSQKIESCFADAYDIFNKATQVGDLYVEYIDVFLCAMEHDDNVNLIIDSASDFIAKGAVSDTGLWHTHSGYFDNDDGTVRRLHQINIDVSNANTPSGLMRAVQIRTFASDALRDPSQGPFDGLTKPWVELSARLNDLHTAAKADFRRILTADAAAAVSLG